MRSIFNNNCHHRFDSKPESPEKHIAIARILPEATVRLRRDATANFVRQNADRFTILHFAAHGHFSADRPLASALLLSGDGQSDGLLTAADLYTLHLKADLVTLSACETGFNGLLLHQPSNHGA
jgi:CHAT domain-containing protein